MTCLEVARNHRLCGGAEEYERRIKDLESRLDSATQNHESQLGIMRLQRERILELEGRLGDAEMRVREIVAWLDVIESKYDPALRRMLGGDWPTYWLSEVRATISGCGVEKQEIES